MGVILAEHHPELLTADEHVAIELTADLWNQLSQHIVGTGASREQDLRELAFHIHAIQKQILGQAAARAYPSLYRKLGDSLVPITDTPGKA